VPYPCPSGQKFIKWNVGPKAGQTECVPGDYEPEGPIDKVEPPPSGPITKQGNPPSGPIGTKDAYTPTGPIPGDTTGLPNGYVGDQWQQQQQQQQQQYFPQTQEKSSVMPIAVAAGAAILLSRLL
jgi:hypothetical protein